MATRESGSELLLVFEKITYPSRTLFNIFLEGIMIDALEDHKCSVSIGGSTFINFRFTADIVVNAKREESVLFIRNFMTTYIHIQSQ